MAVWAGTVGYGVQVETRPGVFTTQIVEYPYMGRITRKSSRMQEGEKVNSDISVSNTIEIVADEFAMQNFSAIKYLNWAGVSWRVDEVEVRAPRLVLRLGGVWDGKKPAAAPSSP